MHKNTKNASKKINNAKIRKKHNKKAKQHQNQEKAQKSAKTLGMVKKRSPNPWRCFKTRTTSPKSIMRPLARRTIPTCRHSPIPIAEEYHEAYVHAQYSIVFCDRPMRYICAASLTQRIHISTAKLDPSAFTSMLLAYDYYD